MSMMIKLLGLILISFFVTSFLLVPFIDLLFYLKRKTKSPQKGFSDKQTPIHNNLLAGKDIETPVGGGLIVIPVVVILTLAAYYLSGYKINTQTMILIFTLISFGFIGLLDDIRKIFISFSGK